MAQIFGLFDQIDGYLEATVTAARIAACFGILIKTNAAAAAFGNLQTQQNQNAQAQRIANIEPGMVQYLAPGDEIQQVSPSQPTQSFPDFVAVLMRFAGLSMGLPLELVMLDFSRTNYSSARAALLQAYRSFRVLQDRFEKQFLRRIYPWWLDRMVKLGEIQVPPGLGDLAYDHKWLAPGWEWVDPLKEIQAALLELDTGLTTLSDLAAQKGKDLYELFARRQRELETMKKMNIPIMHSNSTRDEAQPGETAAAKPEPDDPEGKDE